MTQLIEDEYRISGYFCEVQISRIVQNKGVNHNIYNFLIHVYNFFKNAKSTKFAPIENFNLYGIL